MKKKITFVVVAIISWVSLFAQGYTENFSTGTLPFGWNNSYHGSTGAAWYFSGGEARIVNNAGLLGNQAGPSWLISSVAVPEAGFGTLVFTGRFPTAGPLVASTFLVKITDGISTNYSGYIELLQVNRSASSSGGTQEYRLKIPQSYWGKNCYIAFIQSVNGVLSVDSAAIDNLRLESDPLYSRMSGLSSGAIWSESLFGPVSAGNFTPNTSIVIQSGHQVQFNEPRTLFNITNNPGSNLRFTVSGVAVNGNISNKGIIDSRGNEVIFSGKYKQLADGDWYAGNVLMKNEAGMEWLAGNLRMYGGLNFSGGILKSNGKVLLINDSLSEGTIGPLTPGALQGSVQVQRYIAKNKLGWNWLTAPIAGIKVQVLNNYMSTSGYEGSDNPAGPVSGYAYDETLSGSISQGMIPIDNANATFSPGGALYFNCLDNSQSQNAFTLLYNGQVNQGEILVLLDYTNTGNKMADGVNFLGNPYPATVEYDRLVKTGIASSYWVYLPSEGISDAWNSRAKVGLINANGQLGSNQSFIVQANQTGASIGFSESVKSVHTSTGQSRGQLAIAIKKTDGSFKDVTLFNLDQSASREVEVYDSQRMDFNHPDAPAICNLINGNSLSINSWPAVQFGDSVQLGIKVAKTGEYNLSLFRRVGFDTMNVVLVNLLTGSRYLVDSNLSVNLSLITTTEYQPWALVFEPKSVAVGVGNRCYNDGTGYLVARGSGIGPWSYTWFNPGNEVIRQTTNIYYPDTLLGYGSGEFRVQIASGSPYPDDVRWLTISNPEPIVVVATVFPETCPEKDDGKIVANVSGGTGSLSFLWSNQQEGDIIANLKSGNYSLSVQDENFCKKNDNYYEVTEPDTLRVVIFAFDSAGKFEKVTFNSQSNLPVIGHKWSFGDGSFAYSDQVEHQYLDTGVFNVELEVESESHCFATKSHQIRIIEYPNSVVDPEFSKSYLLYTKNDYWFLLAKENKTDCELVNVLGQKLWEQQGLKKGEEVQLPIEKVFSATILRIRIGEKAYSKQIRFY